MKDTAQIAAELAGDPAVEAEVLRRIIANLDAENAERVGAHKNLLGAVDDFLRHMGDQKMCGGYYSLSDTGHFQLLVKAREEAEQSALLYA